MASSNGAVETTALSEVQSNAITATNFAEEVRDAFDKFQCLGCNTQFSKSNPPWRVCENANMSKMNGARRSAYFKEMDGEDGNVDFAKFGTSGSSGCVMCHSCVFKTKAPSGAPSGHSKDGDCAICFIKHGATDPKKINRAIPTPVAPVLSGIVCSVMNSSKKYEDEQQHKQREERNVQVLKKMQESTQHDFFPYKGPVTVEAIGEWQKWKREREAEQARLREEAKKKEEAEAAALAEARRKEVEKERESRERAERWVEREKRRRKETQKELDELKKKVEVDESHDAAQNRVYPTRCRC